MSNTDNVSWVFDLEDKIFSLIKANGTIALKTKYPNIRFTTTSNNSGSTAKFPVVYIHELPGNEIGQDLEGTSINGVSYSMQVEVYSNTSQSDCKTVIKEIALLYKKLGFDVYSLPEFNNLSTIYRNVMRVRRTICQGDIIK